jgi:hypothetical protein
MLGELFNKNIFSRLANGTDKEGIERSSESPEPSEAETTDLRPRRERVKVYGSVSGRSKRVSATRNDVHEKIAQSLS